MVDFNIQKIEDFLMSAPRYRFVVITKGFDHSDFQVLDVGNELACCIKDDVSDKKNLPFIASEKLLKLFDDNITEHPKFGSYICLDNTGILFEPALEWELLRLCSRTLARHPPQHYLQLTVSRKTRLYLHPSRVFTTSGSLDPYSLAG